jgi:PHP family Zn ribbon phosphoesterase
MNIGQAMIIKTSSQEQTELVQKLREIVKAAGNDMVVVPNNVTDLFITVQIEGPVVILQCDLGPFGMLEVDIVKGFDSVQECWEYARLVTSEAGLSNDSIAMA